MIEVYEFWLVQRLIVGTQAFFCVANASKFAFPMQELGTVSDFGNSLTRLRKNWVCYQQRRYSLDARQPVFCCLISPPQAIAIAQLSR